MTQLRLVADDLTGALDSAAQFVVPGRPISVFLDGKMPESLPRDAGVDSGTREASREVASLISTRLAPVLEPMPGRFSFKKIDSLLRGHAGIELAALLHTIPVRYCLVAPAYPYYSRVTRGGLQFGLSDGHWHQVGEHLHATLRSRGIESAHVRAGDSAPEGVSLWDAETDEDLQKVVEAGKEAGSSVLWCGSGGLASALGGGRVPEIEKFERPLLGIFGSDQPATTAQLAACGEQAVLFRDGADAAAAAARLEQSGTCLVNFLIAPLTSRPMASSLIADGISKLLASVGRPGTLVVAGGETLRAVCLRLGADSLSVTGQIMPGVPVSRMVGGRWDGVRVISKSGAFGAEGFLKDLVAMAGPAPK